MPWHPPRGLFAFSAPALFLLAAAVTTASVAADLASAAYLIVAEILAAFGSATDMALERHSRSRVLALAEKVGKTDRTIRRLRQVPTYNVTAWLVRFLGQAMLVLGIAYLALSDHFGDGAVAASPPWGTFAWLLLLLFFVMFIVNDVLVRLFTARRPHRTLLAALPYLEALRWILAPLRLPLVWAVRLLFRVNLDANAPTAREEILETVEEGEREGSFTPEEAEMIGSIIEMETSLVKEVLTPRADMVMLQADATVDQAVELVRGEGYSRVPVYGKDRDDVIGVLYAHDLLGEWGKAGADERTVQTLMRTPFFVPVNKPLNDLLKEMRARKVHLAVVLDEFNGTEGLVTIEDLLEEIVGEIEDEYDADDVAPPTKEELDAGPLEVEARMSLEDLNEALEVDLPIEDDAETIGGLVFHILGKVPAVGDRVAVGSVVITVLEANERTALTVRVEVGEPGAGMDDPAPSA